jgi:CRISPR-associated protein Cas2
VKKQFTIISYDIRDPQRLKKAANCLLDYAERMQYSLFEAWLDKAEFTQLQATMSDILDADDDIQYHRLCDVCEPRVIRIGLQSELKREDFIVL